jgi:hypothetical protein
MRMIIGTQADYPVISIVGSADVPQQLPVEGATGDGSGRPGGKPPGSGGGRGSRFSVEAEVDMDDALVERYTAARDEWVEVQRLLMEEHGQALLDNSGSRQQNPRMMLRMMERESGAEWLPEEQERNWGVRGRRPR